VLAALWGTEIGAIVAALVVSLVCVVDCMVPAVVVVADSDALDVLASVVIAITTGGYPGYDQRIPGASGAIDRQPVLSPYHWPTGQGL